VYHHPFGPSRSPTSPTATEQHNREGPRSLVNDLDELAGPTVLALDDYHVIDAPDIHESVTFLLDHLL
jgi:ATP/maltotriose-dependent transcriptional regulator MalT